MPQWEYHCILAQDHIVYDEFAEEMTVQAYVTRMGRAGWELVSAVPSAAAPGERPCVTYWLKRPKPDVVAPPPVPEARPAPRPPAIDHDDDDDLPGGFAFGFFGG